MTLDIPTFLLDHILLHLPLVDLINARRVCREWNGTILSRQRLRRKLFLQPPTIDADLLRQPVVIHPVLQQLQSNWASTAEPITLTRASGQRSLPNYRYVHARGNFGVALIEADDTDSESDKEIEAGVGRPGTKKAIGARLEDSPVKDQYATEPALTNFVIALPNYNLLVVRPHGVKVWDVAMGVKQLFDKVCRGRTAGFNNSW